MTKAKLAAIYDPKLFTSQKVIADIRTRKQLLWNSQPLWPKRNIAFNDNDRSLRRKLIEVLV